MLYLRIPHRSLLYLLLFIPPGSRAMDACPDGLIGIPCGCKPEQFIPKDKQPVKLWPGGLLFYKIDRAFSGGFVKKLKNTMKDLEKNVGPKHIQFVEATLPSGGACRKKYINIRRTTGGACAFDTGVQPDHPTNFDFNENSCPDKKLLAGLLNAIGLTWESNRPNRDYSIKFHPQNIVSFLCFAYEFAPEDSSLGMDYDTDSFLHHSSCEFSCNGHYVVTKMDGSPIPEKSYLSPMDLEKLRRLYPIKQKVQHIQDKYCSDKSPEQEVVLVEESPRNMEHSTAQQGAGIGQQVDGTGQQGDGPVQQGAGTVQQGSDSGQQGAVNKKFEVSTGKPGTAARKTKSVPEQQVSEPDESDELIEAESGIGHLILPSRWTLLILQFIAVCELGGILSW